MKVINLKDYRYITYYRKEDGTISFLVCQVYYPPSWFTKQWNKTGQVKQVIAIMKRKFKEVA